MVWLLPAVSSVGSAIGSAAGGIGKGILTGVGQFTGLPIGAELGKGAGMITKTMAGSSTLPGLSVWNKVGMGLGTMLASRTATGQAASAYSGMTQPPMLTQPPEKRKKPNRSTQEMLWELAGINPDPYSREGR